MLSPGMSKVCVVRHDVVAGLGIGLAKLAFQKVLAPDVHERFSKNRVQIVQVGTFHPVWILQETLTIVEVIQVGTFVRVSSGENERKRQ